MAKRANREAFRWEFLIGEIRPMILAYLDLVGGEADYAEQYKENVGRHISILDSMICLYVAGWFWIDGTGTRQQKLLDNFRAPRRTIRDGLARLTDAGLLVREEDGHYYPTDRFAGWCNEDYERDYRRVERLADAFIEYREALRRHRR